MLGLRFDRRALGAGLAVAMLAGCGGAQSAMSRTIPRNAGPASHGVHKSWMKPGSSGGDLLYVTVGGGDIDVFTYPGGALMGTLTGLQHPLGMCSDANGNVWITNTNGSSGYVLEYAHGGTSPDSNT